MLPSARTTRTSVSCLLCYSWSNPPTQSSSPRAVRQGRAPSNEEIRRMRYHLRRMLVPHRTPLSSVRCLPLHFELMLIAFSSISVATSRRSASGVGRSSSERCRVRDFSVYTLAAGVRGYLDMYFSGRHYPCTDFEAAVIIIEPFTFTLLVCVRVPGRADLCIDTQGFSRVCLTLLHCYLSVAVLQVPSRRIQAVPSRVPVSGDILLLCSNSEGGLRGEPTCTRTYD